jgi:hypothetical protein
LSARTAAPAAFRRSRTARDRRSIPTSFRSPEA